MVRYKCRTSKNGAGRSQKQYHLYVDNDLTSIVDMQPNKNRFFNNAIREYIRNHLHGRK